MFQLSGVVTVDESTPDRFLDEARNRYSILAPASLRAHGDRQGAVSMCLAASGEANIVGHGRPGVLCVGCGAFNSGDPSKLIGVGNIGPWAESEMTSLTLLGCNTGEGEVGADLLFAIARATGAVVRAPTGYVYIGLGCDDFLLESNSGWQTATPAARPMAIFDSEPLHFGATMVWLSVEGKWTDLGFETASEVILRESSLQDAEGAVRRVWTGADAVDVLGAVDFGRPIRRGVPAAIETGRLDVRFVLGGSEVTRSFRILNDNRLQDMEDSSVLYRANIARLRL